MGWGVQVQLMEGMLRSRAQVLKGKHERSQFRGHGTHFRAFASSPWIGLGPKTEGGRVGFWPGVQQMKGPTSETSRWKEVHDQLVCVGGRVRGCQAQWGWDG